MSDDNLIRGRINSFQSMGAVDGPGIRFVVFMQGCPLRCAYCHNPETWSMEGEEFRIEEVVEKALRFRSYFGKNGGVTVSGGEPLMQSAYAADLFRELKEAGIHTALDTSGIGDLSGAEQVLNNTDLVLCDLKFSREEEYERYCKADQKQVLRFMRLTEKMQVPLWVRHVVVPGLNDDKDSIGRIVKIAESHSNLEKLELLPFRKLCLQKYKEMGISFPLEAYPECSETQISDLYKAIAELKDKQS